MRSVTALVVILSLLANLHASLAWMGWPYTPGQYLDATTQTVIHEGLQGLPEENLIFGEMMRGGYIQNDIVGAVVPGQDAQAQIQSFAAYTAPGRTPAQEFDMRKAGVENFPDISHTELCGALIVSTLSGTPPPEIFALIERKNPPWGQDFLMNGWRGLLKEEIRVLFEYAGWDTYDTPPFYGHSCAGDQLVFTGFQGKETLCELWRSTSAGHYWVVGANLGAHPDFGMIVSNEHPVADQYRSSAHWVLAEQIIPSHNGDFYVRVYNPYQNREEIYRWEDFYTAWTRNNHDVAGLSFMVERAASTAAINLVKLGVP